MLGYDAVALARLPVDSTASFAGVANPHRIAPITAGATVVDIGCGAGMDLLLAAEAVGPGGRAIGVDMTEAMAERARAGARSRALANVEKNTITRTCFNNQVPKQTCRRARACVAIASQVALGHPFVEMTVRNLAEARTA